MKSIDEMLSQVATLTGSTPPAPPKEKKAFVHNKPNTQGVVKKSTISLELAKEIICCIEKGAVQMGINAVISVVNADGRLVALEAMDNSYLASIKASQDKAYTAAALKMPTHEALEESRGGIFDGLSNGDGILMLGGGYPLTCQGEVIGAVGVSGGTKDEDIALANIGVKYLLAKSTQ